MPSEHERLIQRLEELSPSQSATCLGLLCSYFKRVGLVEVENEVRALYDHPIRLAAHPERLFQSAYFEGTRRELAELAGRIDFDVLALRWLKGLDEQVARELFPEQYEELTVEGLDGRRYKLCRRNDLIARTYGEITWAADQSSSLDAYARFHKLVPLDRIAGRTIDCRCENDWAPGFLQDRLDEELLQDPPALRILLWPFRTQIRFLDFEDEEESAQGIRYVHLHKIDNEDELLDEIAEALAEARRRRATILIFPELSIPERGREKIRTTLEGHGQDTYPILTLFGCCHRTCDEDRRLDVNEAVLLGPDGDELLVHRKLAAYTDKTSGIAERIKVGDRLQVLESRLGNFVPLICLDLPNVAILDLLRETHGNVVLTPSLSPKTGPHSSAAQSLQVNQRASTFVCNRCFGDQPTARSPEGTSFYRVPRSKKPYVAHFPDHAASPYLLFELDSSGRIKSKSSRM